MDAFPPADEAEAEAEAEAVDEIADIDMGNGRVKEGPAAEDVRILFLS